VGVSNTTAPLTALAFANNQYVVVGLPILSADAVILTSPDAANWTARTSGVFDPLFGVGANSTEYVAVGGSVNPTANNTILVSPDAANWTVETSTPYAQLRGVAWNGTTFVAVGGTFDNGVVFTSPDGVTWTSQYPGLIDALSGATKGDGLFVAVGDAGTIVTSPDGVNWASQNSGTTTDLNSVVWTGQNYVAVGDGGIALVSSNGVNWTASPTGTTAALAGVCTWAGRVVAVGIGGLILTADVGSPTVITTQPANTAVLVAHGVKFTVVAAGTGPLTYQWYFNAKAIKGATSASYAIAHAAFTDAGKYTVTVAGPISVAKSKPAVLTVVRYGSVPRIISQPKGISVTAGGMATFSVKADGSTPLSYRWQFNNHNLGNGGGVTGATSPTLRIAAVGFADAGNYRVVVTNPAGTATSASATLKVRPLLPP
jgi:hypothetical protein